MVKHRMAAFARTRTSEGDLAFSLVRYVICLAVMLPATLCAGMTLPLITRMLVASGTGERAIGADPGGMEYPRLHPRRRAGGAGADAAAPAVSNGCS